MNGKGIEWIDIRPDVMRGVMFRQGLSYRGLCDRMNNKYTHTVINRVVKTGRCPTYMLNDICSALYVAPSAIISGKKVWIRLGATVQLTDEEYNYLKKRYIKGETIEISDYLAKELIKRAIVDGDSYIPEECAKETFGNE